MAVECVPVWEYDDESDPELQYAATNGCSKSIKHKEAASAIAANGLRTEPQERQLLKLAWMKCFPADTVWCCHSLATFLESQGPATLTEAHGDTIETTFCLDHSCGFALKVVALRCGHIGLDPDHTTRVLYYPDSGEPIELGRLEYHHLRRHRFVGRRYNPDKHTLENKPTTLFKFHRDFMSSAKDKRWVEDVSTGQVVAAVTITDINSSLTVSKGYPVDLMWLLCHVFHWEWPHGKTEMTVRGH
eukprot:NODE_2864_length_979_cov_68.048122_g2844_i0.p1 GENE.NODE_2864_length_979_cov_68.048122_g2844_i0~~NODE_2864_length_979_cov_68.048122_g2844_i0.p1  ORF type:complete len:263 (-),score=23.55 NODE_2864_length_979_cov_68.048122_g2844_i0:190-924(-)